MAKIEISKNPAENFFIENAIWEEGRLVNIVWLIETYYQREVSIISDLLDKRIKITHSEKKNETNIYDKAAKGGKIRAYNEVKDWIKSL